MSIEIRVPPLPESITDATLVGWHKQPGEAVTRDENLADLETDKVVLEVPAPVNGVMGELKVQSGATVEAGDLLAVIEEGAGAGAGKGAASRPVEAAAQASGASDLSGGASAQAAAASGQLEGASAQASIARGQPADASGQAAAAKTAGKLSPSARRLVEEKGLDASAIPSSGRDGRVTKADVIGYLDKRPASAAQAGGASAQADGAAQAGAAVQPGGATARSDGAATQASGAVARPAQPAARAPAGARVEQRVPMNRLRQRIAQRLLEAQSSQALLTTFNELDLTAVSELRARYKDRFEKREGVKLGFMSFFVRAAIEALKRFPVVNASIDGADIVYHEYYDIGVAVSTDRGLIVPILRDADGKSFAEIEKEIAAYAARARDASIAIEDLTGGTFTITNGGVFGSLLSTPIVNAPQSAILGMHKIQERPMVVNGAIAIRPMMYLALTYDHRIIDGRDAVQFLVAVKESLEDPGRMLLGL